MSDTEKRGLGRPTVYSPSIANAILEAITTGKTVTSACKDQGVTLGTIWHWIDSDRDGFAGRYAEASVTGADAMAGDVIDLADTVGEGKANLTPAQVSKARLQMDARIWYLSKRHSGKYGDRSTVTVEQSGAPTLTDADLERELAAAGRDIAAALRQVASAAGGGEGEGATD